MRRKEYPTTKKVPAFDRPDGSFRPTWEYRGIEIDGLGLKGYVVKIRGLPTCVTLSEARDRVDAYHRRRAAQARRLVLLLLRGLARPVGAQPVEEPDYDDFMELMAQSSATAA